MESANVLLLFANFAGVAVHASQECVSVLTSLVVKLAVWECCFREEVVADAALQCGTGLTLHAYRGILVESANVLLLLAHFAGVAVDASQECVLVLTTFFLKLAVWERCFWDELVADLAV